MRIKTISATLLAAALVAGCGGASSGGSSDEEGTSIRDGSISITGTNLVQTIGPEDGQDVHIFGDGHEITIQPNSSIGKLSLKGDDVVITIHDGTTIDEFSIKGERIAVFTNEVYAINSNGVGIVIAPIP